MSLPAISWALEQPIKSSEKFVLVCLANRVNKKSVDTCFPSIAQLVSDTGQNRKTVIRGLQALLAAGLIADTGKRKGATQQIPVYRLAYKSTEKGTVETVEPEVANGPKRGTVTHLNKSPKTGTVKSTETGTVNSPKTGTVLVVASGAGKVGHYVYHVTDPASGRFYFGARSCEGGAAQDRAFLGDGPWPESCACSGIALLKIVLREYPTRAEADAAVAAAIHRDRDDPLCMNSPKNGTVNDPKNGTLVENKESQIRTETVPFLPDNSPKLGRKESQIRDTEPEGTRKEPEGTIKPPRVALPDWLPPAAWQGFLEMRKRQRKPPTDYAVELLIAELAKLRAAGHDPGLVLDQSTQRSWIGVFPLAERDSRQHGPPRASSTEAASRAATIAGLTGSDSLQQFPEDVIDVEATEIRKAATTFRLG